MNKPVYLGLLILEIKQQCISFGQVMWNKNMDKKKKIMSYGHRQLYNLLKNKTFTWILLEVL